MNQPYGAYGYGPSPGKASGSLHPERFRGLGGFRVGGLRVLSRRFGPPCRIP